MELWQLLVWIGALGFLLAARPYLQHWARRSLGRVTTPHDSLRGRRITVAGIFHEREGRVGEVVLANVTRRRGARNGERVLATGVLRARAGDEGSHYREPALGWELVDAQLLPREPRYIWQGPIFAAVVVLIGVVAVAVVSPMWTVDTATSCGCGGSFGS